MYLEYFQLKTKPFQISPDPRFLWLGETHKEALSILKYGIMDNRGLLLLVGDIGTGKTTLLIQLLPKLKAEGLRIGMIKHAHHSFDVDQEGRDSFRHRTAGAHEVMLASRNRTALMTELRGEA